MSSSSWLMIVVAKGMRIPGIGIWRGARKTILDTTRALTPGGRVGDNILEREGEMRILLHKAIWQREVSIRLQKSIPGGGGGGGRGGPDGSIVKRIGWREKEILLEKSLIEIFALALGIGAILNAAIIPPAISSELKDGLSTHTTKMEKRIDYTVMTILNAPPLPTLLDKCAASVTALYHKYKPL